MRAISTVVLMTGLLFMGTATAQAHRSEVMSEVIDPCYMRMIRHLGGIPGMTNSEALELMKAMLMDDINRLIASVQSVTAGKNRSTKRLLYRYFMEQCASAGIRGMNSVTN